MEEQIEQVNEETDTSAEEEMQLSDFALLFELDNMAINGREISFGILKGLLEKAGTELTPILFSRYCLCAAPEIYIPALLEALGVKKPSAEKLTKDFWKGLQASLSSDEVVLDANLDALVQIAASHGIRIAALSSLSEDAANALAEKLGLLEYGAELFVFSEPEEVFPRADTWMKVFKAMSISPRHCKVLATSSASCKAALSTGMSSVAVPDRFASFQDFGGAAMILDSLADIKPQVLMDELFPISELAE